MYLLSDSPVPSRSTLLNPQSSVEWGQGVLGTSYPASSVWPISRSRPGTSITMEAVQGRKFLESVCSRFGCSHSLPAGCHEHLLCGCCWLLFTSYLSAFPGRQSTEWASRVGGHLERPQLVWTGQSLHLTLPPPPIGPPGSLLC